MTDAIVQALVEHLQAQGLPAQRAYPAAQLDRKVSRVCVGLKSCRAAGSGMGEYLGVLTPGDGSPETELYGLRLEAEMELLLLDPEAESCGAMLDALSAALHTLPSGLKTQALVCSQVKPDKTMGMFCCQVQLHALAYLVAQADADSGTFLDFKLRGVLKNADE